MERVTEIIDSTLAHGLIPALEAEGFTRGKRQGLGDSESYFGRTFHHRSSSVTRLVTVLAYSWKDCGKLMLSVGVTFPQMDAMVKEFPYSGRDDGVGKPNFLVAQRIGQILTAFEVGTTHCFISQKIWRHVDARNKDWWQVTKQTDVASLGRELAMVYHQEATPWFESYSTLAQAENFVRKLDYPLIEALLHHSSGDPRRAAQFVRKHIESHPEETQQSLKWAKANGLALDSDLQARLWHPPEPPGFWRRLLGGFSPPGKVGKEPKGSSDQRADCGVCGAPLSVRIHHGVGEEGFSRAECESCGFVRTA